MNPSWIRYTQPKSQGPAWDEVISTFPPVIFLCWEPLTWFPTLFFGAIFNKSNCRLSIYNLVVSVHRFPRSHWKHPAPIWLPFWEVEAVEISWIWATKFGPQMSPVFFQWNDMGGGPTISRVHIKPPVIHLTNPSNTWSKSSMEWMLGNGKFPNRRIQFSHGKSEKHNSGVPKKAKKATAILSSDCHARTEVFRLIESLGEKKPLTNEVLLVEEIWHHPTCMKPCK